MPGFEEICSPVGFSRAKTPGCPSQAAPSLLPVRAGLSFSCGFPWEILGQGSRAGQSEALHIPHSFSNQGKLLMSWNLLIFHNFELKKMVSAHCDGAVHPCASLEGALPQEEPVLP